MKEEEEIKGNVIDWVFDEMGKLNNFDLKVRKKIHQM